MKNSLNRSCVIKYSIKLVCEVNQCMMITCFRIKAAQFTTWSIAIKDLFVGENQFVYYTPFKKVDGRKINAAGLLYEHYQYTNRKLVLHGLLTTRNKEKIASTPQTVSGKGVEFLLIRKSETLFLIFPLLIISIIYFKLNFQCNKLIVNLCNLIVLIIIIIIVK